MPKKADENGHEAQRRVLVVDDDDYIAEFFDAFFDEGDFDLRVASDIEAGREEIKGGEYDILFLDVLLPGADGLDMLKEVKTAVDTGKVVVITGEVTKGLKRRMASLGIERCLGKPFDLAEIREIVKSGRLARRGGGTVTKSDMRNDHITARPGGGRSGRGAPPSCKEIAESSTNLWIPMGSRSTRSCLPGTIETRARNRCVQPIGG